MDTTANLSIIGSGPAALTAAIYASRALLSPIVLAGKQGGGQLMFTSEVENYPGFERGILGPDLMTAMRKQAERFGTRVIDKNAVRIDRDRDRDREIFKILYGASSPSSENSKNSESQSVRISDNQKTRKSGVSILRPASLELQRGEQSDSSGSLSIPSVLKCHAVIIATGATANTLKLPGEDRLMGRGVGTCAVCDAPFYKGRNTVFVVGGGDSAVEEATALAKFAKKIILIVRSDSLRASEIMKNRIKSYANIQIWYKSRVEAFIGEKKLEKVRIERDGTVEDVAADGLFYAIGHTPATGWLKGSGVEIDSKGYILTPFSQTIRLQTTRQSDNQTEQSDSLTVRSLKSDFPTMTSVPGIFAAGDCVDPRYRQAITASGFGCMAALDAQKWLMNF